MPWKARCSSEVKGSIAGARWLAVLLLLLAVPGPAFARSRHSSRSGNDRVSFGRDITVNADESVGDVACAFCSVHVHGNVQGDMAVLFGTMELDGDRTVSGDVALLGGDVVAGDGASIDGDVALLGGDLRLSPGAFVRGDRAIVPGRFWLLLPFAPLLVLAGLIWLAVWLIRRRQYTRYYAAPPPPRMY